jgi:hypothetical protein
VMRCDAMAFDAMAFEVTADRLSGPGAGRGRRTHPATPSRRTRRHPV